MKKTIARIPGRINDYEVIVGNVGTVTRTNDKGFAYSEYRGYVRLSKAGLGRVGNEPVTLMKNGEPLREHTPKPQAAVIYVIVDENGPVFRAFRRGRRSDLMELPKNADTHGNPYLVFGPKLREWLGYSVPTDAWYANSIVVAHVTSGTLR